ncbi:unnamed protein product [Cercopithifilaria johnstoni]|uniref:Uncharacterized protein n=1 Tax=Cercopithifilaria johnstoni TaxID=2874296 RepID=A0A8J2QAX1_9BILA|nr:unnamed protein product [Cercopithifilaria johnstoni]
MASDEKQPSGLKRKGKKQSDQKSSDSSKEEMESFMKKVCNRLEKMHVISRLLEEPEEQTQSSSESRRKPKKSRVFSNNVYEFFCDQPSTSKQSEPKSPSKSKQSEQKSQSKSKQLEQKSPSKKKQSKNEPSSSADQKAKNVIAEEIDVIDLSEQAGTSWSGTSTFGEQLYIENPDEPSTSTGLRSKIESDDETLPKILERPIFKQEDSATIHKPKLSSLYGIHKKPRPSKDSDNTDLAESSIRKGARPKQMVKQTKSEKASSSVERETKLKNEKAKDTRGQRVISKLERIPENQPLILNAPPSKRDRSQRARERLRKKFEEGYNISSSKTRNK